MVCTCVILCCVAAKAKLGAMDTAGLRFGSFHDLVLSMQAHSLRPATAVTEELEQLMAYLGGSDCSLFAGAESLSVQGEEMDQLILMAGSLPQALDHLDKFNRLQRRFSSFDQLAPAIGLAKSTGSHLSSDAGVVAWLASPECSVLSGSGSLGGAELDELCIAGGGQERTLTILESLQRSNQTQADSKQLIAAVKELSDSTAKLMSAARDQVVAFLSDPSCHLFSTATEPLKVLMSDLDAMVLEAGGLESTLHHLHKFNDVGRAFNTLHDIVPAMHHAVESGSHVTEEDYKAVNQLLQNCQLFDGKQPELTAADKDLEALFSITHGLEGYCQEREQRDRREGERESERERTVADAYVSSRCRDQRSVEFDGAGGCPIRHFPRGAARHSGTSSALGGLTCDRGLPFGP